MTFARFFDFFFILHAKSLTKNIFFVILRANFQNLLHYSKIFRNFAGEL